MCAPRRSGGTKREGGEDMKKAEPQVPFVPYRSDDRAPHERVLDLMDMAHAKTCCILRLHRQNR